MKKIISMIICLMMLATFVTATNRAPTPRPFEVYVFYQGESVEGFSLEFTINGQTITKKTNSVGGVMVDWDLGYSVDFPVGKEINGLSFYSQVLSVRCGLDACDKDYPFDGLEIPTSITINLADAPVIDDLEPEPEPIPEPVVEDKVTSNSDNTIALIESNYGECVDVVITDNKLSSLIDDVIDFDTEDYDVHEEIRVKYCIETSIDDSDYGLDPVIVIEEGEIEYRYVFDDILPLADIEDDEELEIKFLVEDYEIISLSSSKMTVRHGEVFDYLENCVEGEIIDFDGLPLTIGTIGDDFVYVTYNGDSEQIYREDTGEVGGIQVYVDEAIPREDKPNICKIRVAEDIEEVIEDGDEYNDDYDYVIQDGYIGITNSKEFKYLDEENKPLKLGDKIELPNGVIIKFNEITSSDVTEIDIRVRDSYLNVNGDKEDSFTFNNQDYDELFVGSEGILDEDKVLISNKVRIGESDVYLEKGSIIIGDLVIEMDFLDILYKGISYATKDESYLTHEGIIFKNPEDSVNGHSTFDIIVPDEIPEVKVTIGAESETIGLPVEPEECPAPTTEECLETVCPKEKVCSVTSCPPCAQTECPVVTCPEPEGDNLGAIIISAIAALLTGGFGGKYFTKNTALSSQGGLKTHMGRDGIEKVNHKHRGIRGYHDPYTSHRDEVERHPKGQLLPHYKQNEKGVWEYIK